MAKAWEGTRKLDLNNPSYSKNTPYEDWMKEIPEFDELKDYLREEKGGKIYAATKNHQMRAAAQ